MSQVQFGGKLLGQGAYGCVFNSTLHCKQKRQEPDENNDTIMVSKLTTIQEAEIEYNISNIIRKIPLWKNYFAPAESMCQPAKKQTETDIKHCDVIEDQSISGFRILFMENAGDTLNTARFHLPTFDLMRFVSHLIEAGALLTLYGIVHRDLHGGNILVDQYNVPRIIDFNLSMNIQEPLTKNTLLHQHDPIHLSQEPPDATISNAIALANEGHIFTDGLKVIDTLIHRKPILKRIRNLLGISESSMKNSLYQFYQQSKSLKDGDLQFWFKCYWRTYDSWGIGTLIVNLLTKLSIMPAFSMNQYRDTLFPILRKMCAVNPKNRIDCVQALYQLNPNHFIIQRYGQAWLKKTGTDVSN